MSVVIIMTTDLGFGFIISAWACAHFYFILLYLIFRRNTNAIRECKWFLLKSLVLLLVFDNTHTALRGPHHNDFHRSLSVVLKLQSLDQQQQHHLGTCLKCQFSGSPPDILSQKLWEWGWEICGSSSPAGDSQACSSLNPLLCSASTLPGPRPCSRATPQGGALLKQWLNYFWGWWDSERYTSSLNINRV